ncbi:hypothetical protein [Herbaspirillum sp. RV1423]|uniref:hypothetical protein n=1 Tax=Herbaspirillum sp. RV1423 TaxID=1443993 RepID=UPI0018CC6FD7|nr:hypothetical protein [Herbaspirillum sp. RV1423]
MHHLFARIKINTRHKFNAHIKPMQEQNPYRTVRRNPDDYSEVSDALGRHFQLRSHDLKNTRDLRTLLLDAAYELQAQPDLTDAHIYLHSCTLAKKRVEIEVEQFKRITQPHIAGRIMLHDIRATAQHSERLAMDGASTVSDPFRKPTTASQEAVLAYFLQRHLQSLPGVSISTIAADTKASLPTIYKVLNTYDHCIEKDPEDKTLRLHYFAQSDWLHWIQRTNQLSSAYFIDRSGAPRSANRLAKELARLQRDDLAVGGLMGALHHLPTLDATNSPQLDILVHGTRRTDLSFITEIDPGLERYKGRTEMAHVVVHFIDRPASLFVYQDGQNWGALPDCIANMQKAGLTHQVNDALQLMKQGQKP